jgi:NADH-quinone oxidoreductase subunit F
MAAYLGTGGYEGLAAARAHGPAWVCEQVEAAELRGRGGASFPLARKWRAALDGGLAPIVVANGAEDEPGSAKDRWLLATRPHAVLEGALITAHALAAPEVVLYVNSESTVALDAVGDAVRVYEASAHHRGDVEIRVVAAPPAYVAGEDSAAVEFLQSGVAQPRVKPPYPAENGLRGRPTVVSNVETLAHVTLIARDGADAFREVGCPELRGSLLATLPTTCPRPGVHEVEGGSSLADLIERHGGGVPSGIRGVQVGGPAAGFLVGDLSVALTPSALAARGTSLGCLAVRILVEGACAVDAVAEVARFFARESCGKCPPCRMETQYFERVLSSLRQGGGITEAHVDKALELADQLAGRGACALPRFPVAPLVTARAAFAADFAAHLAGEDCGLRHGADALAVAAV